MKQLIEVLQKYPDGRMVTPDCEGRCTKITGIKINDFDKILLRDSSDQWWFVSHCEPYIESQS